MAYDGQSLEVDWKIISPQSTKVHNVVYGVPSTYLADLKQFSQLFVASRYRLARLISHPIYHLSYEQEIDICTRPDVCWGACINPGLVT